MSVPGLWDCDTHQGPYGVHALAYFLCKGLWERICVTRVPELPPRHDPLDCFTHHWKGWEWLGNISEAKDDGTKVKAPKLPDSHMRRSQDDWRQLHPEGQGRAQQEGRGTLNHFGGYWRTKPDAFDQELVMKMFESGVCSVESRFSKWSPWGFPGIWCKYQELNIN